MLKMHMVKFVENMERANMIAPEIKNQQHRGLKESQRFDVVDSVWADAKLSQSYKFRLD